MNAASRRPASASPISASARPSPYISAVSMSVRPRSMPRRSVASSSARAAGASPIFHVPMPSAGTRSPEGRETVFVTFWFAAMATRRYRSARGQGGTTMPILAGVTLLIQLCFAYHALKTGRASWWLFVIMGFPVIGCVLYYFVEVFPTSRESRKAEKAVRAIARALDPDKGLRERAADFEACGSVENRVLLARECSEQKMYAEAAALYRSCLAGVHADDPELRYGL